MCSYFHVPMPLPVLRNHRHLPIFSPSQLLISSFLIPHLLTARCSLLTAHCSLLTAHCSLHFARFFYSFYHPWLSINGITFDDQILISLIPYDRTFIPSDHNCISHRNFCFLFG